MLAQRPEQTERRLNDLMAVSEVGRKLASILDLNELLVQVVDLICSRFGYYHVQVFLVARDPSQAGLPGDRAYFMAGCGKALHEKWRRERRSALKGR